MLQVIPQRGHNTLNIDSAFQATVPRQNVAGLTVDRRRRGLESAASPNSDSCVNDSGSGRVLYNTLSRTCSESGAKGLSAFPQIIEVVAPMSRQRTDLQVLGIETATASPGSASLWLCPMPEYSAVSRPPRGHYFATIRSI